MNEIKWQEPPPGWGARGWKSIFDQLRKRPGEWALVAVADHPTTASNIKRGRYAGTKPGEFEAASRKNAAGKYDIYARYVGDPEATR